MAAPRAPEGLQTRGRRLWRQLHVAGDWGPAQVVLIEEACRIADRLDRLDALLAGDVEEWARVEVPEGHFDGRLIVNGLLAEARQQQTTLRGIVAELRAAGGKAKPASKGASVLDQLTAKRNAKARQSTAAG